MPRSDGVWFLVIWNKSIELRFGLRQSELIFGPGWGRSSYEMRGARGRWLSQWVESCRWTNSQHRKIVSLSPCVENLNLKKVIKVSYLNQKRVVSVSCFSDSWAYEHSMLMNIINVFTLFVSWSYFWPDVTVHNTSRLTFISNWKYTFSFWDWRPAYLMHFFSILSSLSSVTMVLWDWHFKHLIHLLDLNFLPSLVFNVYTSQLINMTLIFPFWVAYFGIMVRVLANGPGDLGSIPGRVIPKTQKMVLDAALLNTHHCKVRIKGKVEQSRERRSALPYTSV